jgi:hypothetical protein
MVSSPLQQVDVFAGQLFNNELARMFGIEKEFIDGERARVNVDDLQCVTSKNCAFFLNERVNPEGVGLQGLSDRTAQIEK